MQCLHPIFVQVQVLALASARSVSPAASYLKIGMPHHPQVTKCPGSWFGPRSSGSLTKAIAAVVASGVSHRVRVQPQSCGCVSSRDFRDEHLSLWEKLELCDSRDSGISVNNVLADTPPSSESRPVPSWPPASPTEFACNPRAAFAFDLASRRAMSQTTQIATWVQAERRWRGCVSSRDFRDEYPSLWQKLELCHCPGRGRTMRWVRWLICQLAHRFAAGVTSGVSHRVRVQLQSCVRV